MVFLPQNNPLINNDEKHVMPEILIWSQTKNFEIRHFGVCCSWPWSCENPARQDLAIVDGWDFETVNRNLEQSEADFEQDAN